MKWLNIFIESLVIFLILFSPLVYAGNRPIPITIIESLSFLLLFVFLLRESLQGRLVLVKAPVLALIAFIGLIIFQLIPLPAAVLSAISPNTFTLYKDFFLGPLQNLTLSIYPEATTSLLLQLLSYLAAFFVILNYVDNEEKGRRIIFTIIISGSLYALYGLLRKLVTPIGLFSTFGNRDHFAAYMEMIIPLCISYVFIESSRTKKAVIVFLASIMSLALVLSLCRAGIICFSLSLLLFIFLFRLKRPLKKGLIVGLAFILVLGLFLAAIGTETVTKRLDTLRNPLKAMTGRAEVLQNSPPIIADFPVFGTGFNTFGDIFRKYEVVKANVLRFAHNEPLQLIIETGFIGFLLVFCFLL
ncbi:MAG: O-antigen ligase family protein, partial [Candidatus Omnitrophica bacterium]|nr:O-antigen ligase family protein [Candidatus Omnitrophota bacterium]